MPRSKRWLVPPIALLACACAPAGASAATETQIARAAQADTAVALAERDEARRVQRRERRVLRRVLAAATRQIGDAYASGAGGPDAFDCSGLTRFAFAVAGVDLPHQSHAQAGRGRPVAKGDIRAGDLVFFSTAGAGASHVGIATGSRTVVSATNSGVMEHRRDDAYWGGHYVTARRVL